MINLFEKMAVFFTEAAMFWIGLGGMKRMGAPPLGGASSLGGGGMTRRGGSRNDTKVQNEERRFGSKFGKCDVIFQFIPGMQEGILRKLAFYLRKDFSNEKSCEKTILICVHKLLTENERRNNKKSIDN